MATPTHAPSDALVFFGATGDLAYKKIFPSLQAMLKRGHLDVPVIGVAKAGWTLEQFQARARDSLEKHGGLDPAALRRFDLKVRFDFVYNLIFGCFVKFLINQAREITTI